MKKTRISDIVQYIIQFGELYIDKEKSSEDWEWRAYYFDKKMGYAVVVDDEKESNEYRHYISLQEFQKGYGERYFELPEYEDNDTEYTERYSDEKLYHTLAPIATNWCIENNIPYVDDITYFKLVEYAVLPDTCYEQEKMRYKQYDAVSLTSVAEHTRYSPDFYVLDPYNAFEPKSEGTHICRFNNIKEAEGLIREYERRGYWVIPKVDFEQVEREFPSQIANPIIREEFMKHVRIKEKIKLGKFHYKKILEYYPGYEDGIQYGKLLEDYGVEHQYDQFYSEMERDISIEFLEKNNISYINDVDAVFKSNSPSFRPCYQMDEYEYYNNINKLSQIVLAMLLDWEAMTHIYDKKHNYPIRKLVGIDMDMKRYLPLPVANEKEYQSEFASVIANLNMKKNLLQCDKEQFYEVISQYGLGEQWEYFCYRKATEEAMQWCKDNKIPFENNMVYVLGTEQEAPTLSFEEYMAKQGHKKEDMPELWECLEASMKAPEAPPILDWWQPEDEE